MRTTRVLAIAAILGIAFSFRASANVVYDSETTNVWFDAEVATSSTLTSNWTPPSKGGEAVVKGESNAHYIALDTDLDDPLTYAATDASADIAVVAAEMTATVNATEPQIGSDPQAALAVIGDATAINWVGLIGDGKGGTTWVTFPTPVPVAGNPYSVRIEFDQRATKKIRYLVNGVVLSGEGSSDGWYPNPKADAAKISNVSFSGSGDIRALAGENITENTFEFVDPTETAGYDFTNGSFSVGANIQGYTGVKATLKVVDFNGNQKTIGEKSLSDQTSAQWDLTGLEAGGFYDYTVEVKAGDRVIDTLSGTFYAANWTADVWFGADATGGSDNVTGGAWDQAAKPDVENNAYTIDDEAIFKVNSEVRSKGQDHVTRVDAAVTFDALVANPATPEGAAFGGFVAAQDGWMALTRDGWSLLRGDSAPEPGVQYVIRAEVDFHTDGRGVRYFVTTSAEPADADFVPLYDENGNQWIPLANSVTTFQQVELQGSGKVAKFEATVANKALAKVGETEYDTMEAALAVAKDNGKEIILLTNATVEPKEKGSYDIAPGAYQYVSGGKVSSEERTIVINNPDEPPVVRPSTKEMQKVETPEGAQFKDINKLREFLERNGVTEYTKDDASANDITAALQTTPQDAVNNLKLWQDYALGIDKTDPVDPVTTPAGDTAIDGITLAIPAVDKTKYSGDYAITYQVDEGTPQEDPKAIKVPLETGNHKIKAVFTATPAALAD